jgi:hypothetical protein
MVHISMILVFAHFVQLIVSNVGVLTTAHFVVLGSLSSMLCVHHGQPIAMLWMIPLSIVPDAQMVSISAVYSIVWPAMLVV